MPKRATAGPPAIPSVDASLLRASATGTAAYAMKWRERFAEDHFRQTPMGVTVSSIGIGTYLGDCDDADDQRYAAAIGAAIRSGINLIDTSLNYRCQRSEQVVGAAVHEAIASGDVARDQLVICSKGGYIPLDQSVPATRDAYRAYVQREFIDSEILRPEDIVAGGHSLAPRFLRYCLAKSRQNLGLRTVDIYYVHNPEQQLAAITRAELDARLRAAFEMLEEACGRGEIGVYGCATWNGLRVGPDHRDHVSLTALVEAARDVAGEAHHFRVVQAPLSIGMPEAFRAATQIVDGELISTLEAAAHLGIGFVASASLMQGALAKALPPLLRDAIPPTLSDAQGALDFVRGVPGVLGALVGMRDVTHLEENLGAARAR